MASNFNLTDQHISSSFQRLMQISSSNYVNDGTGSLLSNLEVTSSYATTASYALNGGVTSIIAGTNITVDQATGDVTISSTGGGAADTGSLLVTSSVVNDTITFEKGDGSTYTNVINNVSSSLATEEIFITAKNVQGVSIPKGYAVHAEGVTGENVNITTASYDDANLMPAIGITQTAINAGAAGEVIISGRLKDVNTSGLVAGANVYVNGDGSLTSTKPTGSSLIQNIGICAKVNATEGEIIVMGAGRSNDVPNITENYLWVGNSDGVATPTDKDALTVGTASLALDVISTADLNVNSITANTGTFTSASIGYLQAVTGSAKIIGDAFIILNNDTPTERYAGIKVIDSGSTQATASLQFDGQTNDWFYEYTASGDPLNHGVVMFGPEYGTIGSPTYPTNNTLLKGNGGHHVQDSRITDDGTHITIGDDFSTGNIYLSSSVVYVGKPGFGGGNAGIEINVGSEQNTLYGNTDFYGTKYFDGQNNFGGGSTYQDGSSITIQSGSSFNINSGVSTQINSTIDSNVTISGSVTSQGGGAVNLLSTIPGNFQLDKAIQYPSVDSVLRGHTYGSNFIGMLDYSGVSSRYDKALIMAKGNSDAFTYSGLIYNAGYDMGMYLDSPSGSIAQFDMLVQNTSTADTKTIYYAQEMEIGVFPGRVDTISIGLPGASGNSTLNLGAKDQIELYSLNGPTTITGSLDLSGGAVTAEVQALTISSNTASLDLSTGNFFTLDLVSGSDTLINPTNIVGGQTVNIEITQANPGNGTVSFPSSVKQVSGSAYVASTGTGPVDIVTLVSFDSSNIYLSNVKNLI